MKRIIKFVLKSAIVSSFILNMVNLSKVSNAYELNKTNLTSNLLKTYLPGLESSTYVYTPNKTKVLVKTFKEMSDEEIKEKNESLDKLVPNAKRIAPSTNKYNCHSYAWYSQTTTNTYWMDDPSSYYTDYSYEETDGNVGDIICYYSKAGTNLHSGVIISKNSGTSNNICGNSNLFTVRSKWSNGGLYEHRGDQCPYTSTYDGIATYVKFYKLHHHNYNLNYKWKNYNVHQVSCKCNRITTQGHIVSSDSYQSGSQYAKCLSCGGTAKIGFIQASLSMINTKTISNKSFILPNGAYVLTDNDIKLYLNNEFDLNSLIN